MSVIENRENVKQYISSNKHTIIVYSIEAMDDLVRKLARGRKDLYDEWSRIRSHMEGFSGIKTLADDIYALTKLLGALGAWNLTLYIRNYGGYPHIVVKGTPGLLKVLTDSKTFHINNPKVIAMGLGKSGAIGAAKSGGVISIVLMTLYRVTDYILTDKATLTSLIGHLATDVVKIGITVGASIAVVEGAIALGVTLAIGPIVAVIAVGFLGSLVLGAIDNHFHLTDKVVAALDELHRKSKIEIDKKAHDIGESIKEIEETVFDYVVDSTQKILIKTANHMLKEFLNNGYSIR